MRMIEFYRCVFDQGESCDLPRNLALKLADSCRISLAKRSRERVDDLQNMLPVRKLLLPPSAAIAPSAQKHKSFSGAAAPPQ